MPQSSQPYRTHRFLIIVFALIGLAIMSYLTYIHYANARSFCDISEKISCDVVTTSIYSEIFGLPVSLLGFGYFGFALFIGLFRRKPAAFQALFFITLFALIPSLYLSSMELFVIKALCILCETSKLLMIGVLITSFLAARSSMRITMRAVTPVLIAGIVLAGVTYFAQTGTVIKHDYSTLVQCMNDKRITYYKSFKCNNCKRQEKLLGDAYLKLNSVECHPDGPNGNPELCLAKKIEHTPTFIKEKDGTEIDRAVGLQSIEALATFSGCTLTN